MKRSVKIWISLISALLIIGLLYITRYELVRAWELLSQVNPWILLLMVPIVLLNYFSVGEMIFSYLRQKGLMKRISPLKQIGLTLEMNFVNHVMPTGGLSGITYMTLRLRSHGVPAGKATMAQVVRLAMGFVAFVALLALAVLLITIDGNVNRVIILVSTMLVGLMLSALVVGMYFLWTSSRVRQGASLFTQLGNRFVRSVTLGRKQDVLKRRTVEKFLMEMHEDLIELKKDQQILIKPFIWGIVYTLSEVMLFFVAFWALGTVVNPAPILIGFGLATVAGFAVATPGGAGPYEALMVGFLALSGINQGTALAGVLIARVFMLLVILVPGYILYQHAVAKHGIKPDDKQPTI
jgi:putative heme transporter